MTEAEHLRALCAKVEALAPGSFAGVTLSNDGYTHIERAIFPTLPYSFSAAITHVPLEPADFGSCVKAISTGRPITCPDVQNDNVFDPQWRNVCLSHGLRAVQSRPVYIDGRPRGTFVLAFPTPKPESEWDAALMTFAADAVSAILSGGDGAAQSGLSAPAEKKPAANDAAGSLIQTTPLTRARDASAR